MTGLHLSNKGGAHLICYYMRLATPGWLLSCGMHHVLADCFSARATIATVNFPESGVWCVLLTWEAVWL